MLGGDFLYLEKQNAFFTRFLTFSPFSLPRLLPPRSSFHYYFAVLLKRLNVKSEEVN